MEEQLQRDILEQLKKLNKNLEEQKNTPMHYYPLPQQPYFLPVAPITWTTTLGAQS